jgi:C4-type Zn-finger protein
MSSVDDDVKQIRLFHDCPRCQGEADLYYDLSNEEILTYTTEVRRYLFYCQRCRTLFKRAGYKLHLILRAKRSDDEPI